METIKNKIKKFLLLRKQKSEINDQKKKKSMIFLASIQHFNSQKTGLMANRYVEKRHGERINRCN